MVSICLNLAVFSKPHCSPHVYPPSLPPALHPPDTFGVPGIETLLEPWSYNGKVDRHSPCPPGTHVLARQQAKITKADQARVIIKATNRGRGSYFSYVVVKKSLTWQGCWSRDLQDKKELSARWEEIRTWRSLSRERPPMERGGERQREGWKARSCRVFRAP